MMREPTKREGRKRGTKAVDQLMTVESHANSLGVYVSMDRCGRWYQQIEQESNKQLSICICIRRVNGEVDTSFRLQNYDW